MSKDKLYYEDMATTDIRWNFEKFLIDTEGRPVMRYSEKYDPENIEEDVKELLMSGDMKKRRKRK